MLKLRADSYHVQALTNEKLITYNMEANHHSYLTVHAIYTLVSYIKSINSNAGGINFH